MTVSKKEGDEWAASVMAGEMKNSWQAEDRPNIPDARPESIRPVRALPRSQKWYENYDLIDWSK